MTWEHWWFLTKETLRPETGTWVMMFLPIVIGLIMIACYRGKTPPFKGAWSELGRRWSAIGLTVLIISVVSYSVCVYKFRENNYQQQYIRHLKDNSKSLFNKLDFSWQMHWLVQNCPKIEGKDGLKECILDQFRIMKPEERHKFISMIHSMPDRRPITYNYPFVDQFFDPLYWPPERIEEFIKTTGKKPGITDTLKLTSEQEGLYKQQDKEKLHKSLSNEQWGYLVGQFITYMDQDELASLIKQAALNDNLGPENATIVKLRNGDPDSKSKNFYVEKGLNGVLEELDNPPKECAFLAGVPQEFEIFDFFISHYNWLRELPYLLIYLIAGIVMLVSGGLMIRQGKKPLLNI